MKFLLFLLIGASALVVTPIALVLFVVTTNPWLALPALQGRPIGSPSIPVGSTPNGLGISVSGQIVPADQWTFMQQVAQQSTCGVSSLDLAAMGKIESEWGKNMLQPGGTHFGYGQFDKPTWAAFGSGNPDNFQDALPSMARALCGKGYVSNRTAALNSYGGCLTSTCLGVNTYAGLVDVTIGRMTTLQLVPNGDVVGVAKQFLGVSYLWGGTTSTGLDCSGLVYLAFTKLGITTINGKPFPRTSQMQAAATGLSGPNAIGSLVYFANTNGPGITHVGVVVDPVKRLMIDAPGSATNNVVRIEPFWEANLAGFGVVVP